MDLRRAVGPALLFVLSAAALTAAAGGRAESHRPPPLPYARSGLTERQAAAHLLDRFAFGARPGEVERVVEMGLEEWLDRQLRAAEAEPRLSRKLRDLSALSMTAEEMVATFPDPGLVLRQARREGVLGEGLEVLEDREAMSAAGRREVRRALAKLYRREGYRPQQRLVEQLLAWKLYRAVYSENQLREVLTDFWSNHLYVSLTDRDTRSYLLSYERDALEPHVLGSFRELLGASAHHPAMLVYLDNARSVAQAGAPTTLDLRRAELRRGRPGLRERRRRALPEMDQRRSRGLNENYARELLELHTLGVDGGYTQQDVIEVARAFSGWTVVPPEPSRREVRGRLARVGKAARLGFVVDGEFLFRADAHDAGAKVVLGERLPPGRGVEDGEEVLDLVARHPATARHLAEKLAVRFVSDDPPAALVERLAGTYLETRGDLTAVIRALAYSPELWAPEARRAKIKSPFELAVSALRALDAEVAKPRVTLEWIARMGQPLYGYQAPTGYPERADAWVGTGALLNRMSFGLALAAGHLRGVTVDLPGLAAGREPASPRAILATYADILLPSGDPPGTLTLPEPADAATAVGMILGSPEFQRR